MRADGFSKRRATPWPSSTGPRSSRRGQLEHAARSRRATGRRRRTGRASLSPPVRVGVAAAMTPPRMASAASISSSLTSRGGATRMASGRTGLTSSPAPAPPPRSPWPWARPAGRPAAARPHAPTTTPGSAASPAAQPRPGPLGPPAHVLALHDGQGGPHRRHGQRLATEGRAVVDRARRRRPPRPGPSRRRPACRCPAPWPWSPRRARAPGPGRRTSGRCARGRSAPRRA